MTGEPGITLIERFLDGDDRLFEELKRGVAWDERLKARKTASFGVSYDYSGISYPPAAMPGELVSVCERIERALGFYPNNCLLNRYPDGASSMGFHSDSSAELAEGTGVAIVSLGAERELVFRSKRDAAVTFRYALKSGSLLYMPVQVQDAWMHAVPRRPGAGERISMTFRSIAHMSR